MADWTAFGTIGAIGVSAAGTWFVYRRGTKGDQALSLSLAADRRAKETEINLATQASIIDQLQEELGRYRTNLNEKVAELAAKDAQLDETRQNLRDMRHELVEARSGLSAAEVIIASLEKTVEALRTEIESLRRLVQDHERAIAAAEKTIADLRAAQ